MPKPDITAIQARAEKARGEQCLEHAARRLVFDDIPALLSYAAELEAKLAAVQARLEVAQREARLWAHHIEHESEDSE